MKRITSLLLGAITALGLFFAPSVQAEVIEKQLVRGGKHLAQLTKDVLGDEKLWKNEAVALYDPKTGAVVSKDNDRAFPDGTRVVFDTSKVIAKAEKPQSSDLVLLPSGSSVSREVANKFRQDANAWKNDCVRVLHPTKNEEYSKDDMTMRKLPVDTRIVICPEMVSLISNKLAVAPDVPHVRDLPAPAPPAPVAKADTPAVRLPGKSTATVEVAPAQSPPEKIAPVEEARAETPTPPIKPEPNLSDSGRSDTAPTPAFAERANSWLSESREAIAIVAGIISGAILVSQELRHIWVLFAFALIGGLGLLMYRMNRSDRLTEKRKVTKDWPRNLSLSEQVALYRAAGNGDVNSYVKEPKWLPGREVPPYRELLVGVSKRIKRQINARMSESSHGLLAAVDVREVDATEQAITFTVHCLGCLPSSVEEVRAVFEAVLSKDQIMSEFEFELEEEAVDAENFTVRVSYTLRQTDLTRPLMTAGA